mgnify:CR=1 FL=1
MISRWKFEGKLILPVACGLLLLAIGALSLALAVVATRPPKLIVVPGVRESSVVVADQVPDGAVRRFGLLYVYHLDDYSPTTVEERSNWVLQFVAPEHQEKVAKSLTERAIYAVRAREASQVVLPLPAQCEVTRTKDGLLRFSATGTRTIYIAGDRKSEERVRYVLELKPAIPTDDAPYGLLVVGQAVRPVPPEEAKGRTAAREEKR